MSHLNQNSDQMSNKQMYHRQDTFNSKKVTPTDLDKAARRLKRYLIICGICGLGLVTILGSIIATFILCSQNSKSGDLSALDIVIPAILFDFFIAIPLGATVGTVAIVQIRKYITNFGKVLHKGWLIFGIIGIILCYVPMILTAFVFCFFYILYLSEKLM